MRDSNDNASKCFHRANIECRGRSETKHESIVPVNKAFRVVDVFIGVDDLTVS